MFKYITIERGETFDDSLAKIRMHMRTLNFRILETPQQMFGNQKVMKLKSTVGADEVKIDGPGFLIDKLYDYFINNRA